MKQLLWSKELRHRPCRRDCGVLQLIKDTNQKITEALFFSFFLLITSCLIYGTISSILSQALESGWKDTALRHVYYSYSTDKSRFVSLIWWFVLFTFSGPYAKIPTAKGGCLFPTLQLPQLGDTLSPLWLFCTKMSSFSHRGFLGIFLQSSKVATSSVWVC